MPLSGLSAEGRSVAKANGPSIGLLPFGNISSNEVGNVRTLVESCQGAADQLRVFRELSSEDSDSTGTCPHAATDAAVCRTDSHHAHTPDIATPLPRAPPLPPPSSTPTLPPAAAPRAPVSSRTTPRLALLPPLPLLYPTLYFLPRKLPGSKSLPVLQGEGSEYVVKTEEVAPFHTRKGLHVTEHAATGKAHSSFGLSLQVVVAHDANPCCPASAGTTPKRRRKRHGSTIASRVRRA